MVMEREIPQPSTASSYDEFPYQSFPFPQTHPDRLDVMKRLAEDTRCATEGAAEAAIAACAAL